MRNTTTAWKNKRMVVMTDLEYENEFEARSLKKEKKTLLGLEEKLWF